ncbi:PKD domain-containing protein [Botryobacter ruber]|uniref:PKD domain-containing protein n=1 Tax=Botryobacter ruber TaxID=2171629 RepID=UPI000E0A0DAC|nr:PKD domain-containing protein [Botryobacter ruber]
MKNFYLLLTCFLLLCAGRVSGQTYILNEDFSSATETTPPTGWANTTVTGVATDKWRFDNLGNRNIGYPFTGRYAIFDSDNYSQGDGAENVVLESKFFDASISNNTLLTFDHFFAGGKNGQGTLEVFNGISWSTIATFTDSTTLPERKLYNLSANVGGVTNAKIRFRWTGDASYFWAIDNIRIYSPLSRDAGLAKLNAPEMPFNAGSQPIKITLANFGINTLTSTTLKWTVNGVAQTSKAWTGSLAIGETEENITLANLDFQQGKQYKLKIWQENPNGQPDLNALNDTLYATLYSSLSGVYTIGGVSPDFVNFTEAVTVLNNAGIVGPVTFKVRDGVYNEQIVIGKVMGASSTNMIVFESESGDSTKAVLRYEQENSILDYTLLLNSAEHVSFKKLGFTRSSYRSYIIKVEQESKNIDFRNCQFNGDFYYGSKISTNSSTNVSITECRLVNSKIEMLYTPNGIINHNVMGRIGYYTTSQDNIVYVSGTYDKPVMSISVESNEITYGSIELYRVNSSSIKGNTINEGIIKLNNSSISTSVTMQDNVVLNNNMKLSSATGNAMIVSGRGTTEISGNRVASVTNATGMLLSSLYGTMVANNIVQTQGQGTTYGISLTSSSNVKLVFNSVHTTGTDLSQARALFIQGSNSNITIKNNIFANSGGGYAAYIATAPTGTNDIDYNNYYSSGGRLGYYAGTDYSNLSSWGQAVGGDANSKAVNPFFKSTTELSINHIALNSAGATISGITKDIDDTVRDASKPDIGAKEYTPAPVDAGLDAFTSPTSPLTGTEVPVKVLLRNQGLNMLSTATINWQVNGVVQAPINWNGNLVSGAAEEVTLNTFSFTGAPLFNIEARVSYPNSQPDPNRYNDTASVKNLVAALSGVYTIGGVSPDFVNFTEAVTVLNNAGIVGPVTFKVRDGVYNEQIVIGKVMGASSTNMIVFESESGDSTKAVLRYEQENSILDYTLLLNSAEHVSFKKLGFTRSSYRSYIIKVEQESKNIDFRNCQFNGDFYYGSKISTNSSTNVSITECRLVNSKIEMLYTPNGIINHNVMGRIGYYTTSQDNIVYVSGTYDKPVMSISVESNEITYGSIELYRVNSSSIKGNTINEGIIKLNNSSISTSVTMQDNVVLNNNMKLSSATGNAMIVSGRGTTEISGNRVASVTNATGMLLSSLYGTMVANNIVQTQGQGTTYGISLTSSSNVKLVFNSVHTTGTDLSQARALFIQGSNSNITIKNNIFANSGGGYAAYIATAPTGTNDIDYNNYYSSGGRLGYYAGTDYSNLSSWGQAVGGDANSKAVNPFFKSTTDLRAYQRALNGAGIPVAGVLLDIDGEIRNSSAPDIGADEFMVDFGITRLISPTLDCDQTSSEPVTANITQFGDVPFTNIKIAYQVNNGTVYTETIEGQINTDIEHTFQQVQDLLQDGRYDFKVWLVDIQDDNINNDTLYVARFKKPRPVASFSFVTQCAGVPVAFQGTASVASGTIARYEWDFGDGKTADVQNPNHIYERSGTYTVTLLAYSDEGCYGSVSQEITITTTPLAKFAASNACAGSPVAFQNESTVSSGSMTYLWSFGDGTSSTEEHPDHVYTAAGTYQVQLTASNSLGCSDTYIRNITIYALPEVTLAAFNPVCEGAPAFNLTGGLPKGGAYSGTGVVDGKFSALTAGIGTHTITYTYTNENGCINTATNTIQVKALPTVSFTGLPAKLCADAAAVTLIGSPVGGVWVGNGMNSSGVFTPATAGVGTHSIEYVYTDAGGCTNKATQTVEVTATPSALTADSNSPVSSGGTLSLTASSISGATYLWSGPGGYSSTAQNPSRTSVTAAMAGTYTVTATVNGCSSSASVTVAVSQAAAITTFSPTSGAPGTSVTITGSGFTGATGVAFNSTTATYTVVDDATITTSVPSGSTTGLISVTTPTGTVYSSSNFTVLPATVTVSGTVRSQAGEPIGNIVVKAKSTTDSQTSTTPASGAFSFNLATGEAYTLAPARRTEVEVANGVTTLDIVLIQRHILGLQSLGSPYRIIAADVNNSGSVTTLDIAHIRSLILRNTTSFPGNRTWAFVKSGFTFANPAMPFPYDSTRTYSSVSAQSNQDFTGIKLGDVNDTWDASTARLASAGSIAFKFKNQVVAPGTEVIVPVTVNDFTDVSGYQFTLNWDPKVLEFARVEHAGLEGAYGTHSVHNGKLTTVWAEPNGNSLSLENGSKVFQVRFKVLGGNGAESKIEIGSMLTKSVAYTGNLAQLDIQSQHAVVKVKGAAYALYQNYPNPFTAETTLHFELPEAQDVQLTIYNALGQVVRQFQGSYAAGEHFVTWKGDDASGNKLSRGAYICRMKAGSFTESVQIILSK